MTQQNLHKSSSNKVIAGVCGGVGEHFNVDPTLIRLAWALAVFLGGSGLVLYILAMIIMPDDPRAEQINKNVPAIGPVTGQEGQTATESGAQAETGAKPPNNEEKRNQIFGLILVAIGGYFLLQRYFPFFEIHNWWPVIIILIGIIVIFRGRGGSR